MRLCVSVSAGECSYNAICAFGESWFLPLSLHEGHQRIIMLHGLTAIFAVLLWGVEHHHPGVLEERSMRSENNRVREIKSA